jgi:hypothetical protein
LRVRQSRRGVAFGRWVCSAARSLEPGEHILCALVDGNAAQTRVHHRARTTPCAVNDAHRVTLHDGVEVGGERARIGVTTSVALAVIETCAVRAPSSVVCAQNTRAPSIESTARPSALPPTSHQRAGLDAHQRARRATGGADFSVFPRRREALEESVELSVGASRGVLHDTGRETREVVLRSPNLVE